MDKAMTDIQALARKHATVVAAGIYHFNAADLARFAELVRENDKDGQRYRWLREQRPRRYQDEKPWWHVAVTYPEGHGETFNGERIDNAIDAAIRAQEKP